MSNLFEKGTIALVTGGSSGIGQACAIDLAKHGAYVIINYSGHKEGAQETLDAVLKAGGAGAIIRANVSVEEDVDNMFKKIMANFKRLDILVNNAGIIRDGYLLMMKKEAFDQVISVNLGGCFMCTQAAVRIMAGQKKGAIVNISSTSGITGSEGQANYSASKAGSSIFPPRAVLPAVKDRPTIPLPRPVSSALRRPSRRNTPPRASASTRWRPALSTRR